MGRGFEPHPEHKNTKHCFLVICKPLIIVSEAFFMPVSEGESVNKSHFSAALTTFVY